MYKLVRDGLDYYLIKPDEYGDEMIVASTVIEHQEEHGISKLTIDEIMKAWTTHELAMEKAKKAYPPDENDQAQAVKQVISRRAYAHGYRDAVVDILTNHEWTVEAELRDEKHFQITNFL